MGIQELTHPAKPTNLNCKENLSLRDLEIKQRRAEKRIIGFTIENGKKIKIA